MAQLNAERPPEWVGAHAHLAEQHKIGWIIWPYKKMAGDTTSPFTFPSPPAWQQKIITFAHTSRTDRDIKDKVAVRPEQKVIDGIFAELLEDEKDAHLIEHPEILRELPGISVH